MNVKTDCLWLINCFDDCKGCKDYSSSRIKEPDIRKDFDKYWGNRGEKWNGKLDIKEFSFEIYRDARCGK